MEKLKIAIGTTSEYKLGFMKDVAREIGIDAELFPIKAESKISEQPLTEKETKTGSLNRAKSALKHFKDADFALGIEIGYHKNKEGKYEMFCYASIIDKKKFKISCISHKFPLPRFHNEKIESNLQLCEYVEAYHKDELHPVKKYVGKMINFRELFIKEAVRQVLLRYLMNEEF